MMRQEVFLPFVLFVLLSSCVGQQFLPMVSNGRFVTTPSSISFDWPGVELSFDVLECSPSAQKSHRFYFEFQSSLPTLSTGGHAFVVNDNLDWVLPSYGANVTFVVPLDLDVVVGGGGGGTVVSVVKRTEALFGVLTLYGIKSDSCKLGLPEQSSSSTRIEFVGDSLTAG